jgi:hemoglobin/transferrin/lactoferrin receptor protein
MAMTAQYINVGSATIDGIDLTAEYSTPKFTASVSYNHTNGKDNETNEYLTTILPQTVKTNLAYNFMKDTTVGFRSTFAEKMDKVNTGTSKIAGYGVHDIYTQYNYNDALGVSFSVNNIFDKAYLRPYTVIPQIGRDYRITVSYKY